MIAKKPLFPFTTVDKTNSSHQGEEQEEEEHYSWKASSGCFVFYYVLTTMWTCVLNNIQHYMCICPSFFLLSFLIWLYTILFYFPTSSSTDFVNHFLNTTSKVINVEAGSVQTVMIKSMKKMSHLYALTGFERPRKKKKRGKYLLERKIKGRPCVYFFCTKLWVSYCFVKHES